LNTQKQIALIVTLFFVFVGGCAAYTVVDIPQRAVDQTQWHKAQSIERGALLFANNCRTCHGLKGEGGVGLPLNGSDKDFQNQDPLILANNRALLTRTLYCGRAGTRMPAWLNTNGGSLNARQIEHLVDLITAPIEEKYKDENGEPTSRGWLEAVEFGENLNHETVVVVGGDTLATIAKEHSIGVPELVAANNGLDPDAEIRKGTKVNIPAATGRNAKKYEVKKDRETLRKINDGQFVGALVLADLNKIPYKVSEHLGTVTLKLESSDLSRAEGLIPFTTLAFPAGSTYIVRPADTVAIIAERHGVSEAELMRLNSGILLNAEGQSPASATEELDAERKLVLPANAVVVVATGATVSTIATTHGITAEQLATAAGLASPTTPVGAGQQLKLPAGARYTVQQGDTVDEVAALHATTAGELARLNNIKVTDHISPAVTIQLPKVDKYVVHGQTLEQIAATFAAVTAKSLAEAQTPPAQENSVYAVGTQLKLPADAAGSAPPDAINQGAGCVQHAVSPEILDQILNGFGPPPAPAEFSTTVLIESNANDWTLTADGTRQVANKGAAKIATGTSVAFKNVAGVHTLTINGEDDEAVWDGADEKQVPFNDAGTFSITCTIHPAMLATLFVE
jgi:LysM repeat protein/plastocyanin/mono/diheme cytochrome c family protein